MTASEPVPAASQAARDTLAGVLRAEGFWGTHSDRWNDGAWQIAFWDALADAVLAAGFVAPADVEARIEAAFSGDEYEENCESAAGEQEWSWWKWLALAAVRRDLTEEADQ